MPDISFMVAVITGDIINSRNLSSEWIDTLKTALEGIFDEGAKWEIFRGDSFQIELNKDSALLNAIYLKACIKAIKGADVRLSIGLGKKNNTSTLKVTEASGEAYINSGEAFDALATSKANMTIKTPSAVFDDDMNLYLKLALIAMDSWGPITAKVVKYTLENHNEKQDKIAQISGRSQSSISEALKRAHFTEIIELEKKYRQRVAKTFK